MAEHQQKLQDWATALAAYEIPDWTALPGLSLYMDQVVGLMEEYLRIYKKSGDKLITPSMINNYVKLGVIPKPCKKRYNRIHLAYLIMVCTLKQILPMSVIQKILPLTLTEKETEQAYMAFKAAQKHVFANVTAEVAESQRRLQENKNAAFSDYFASSVQVALCGNIYKILSEIIAEQPQEAGD
ncbi:MAG: DUF1836 domain-containing protein [Clostridia bacterium]